MTPTRAAAEHAGIDVAGSWDRRRLLATLVAVAAVALLMAVGLAYALHLVITSSGQELTGSTPTHTRTAGTSAGRVVDTLTAGPARRDAIAAAAMLAVPPAAGRSGTPASRPAPGIPIPAAGVVGPAGVATGFPRTEQGAVGQLAAITISVLQSMSIEHTNAVHAAWSEPAAVPAGDWELMSSVQAFLGSASGQAADSALSTVVVTPVGAQVKGSDGPDWTLACVLFDVRASVVRTARVAFGHCSRMQWHQQENRWLIGAGAAPARAPSTWPGTQIAHDAGWAAWVPAEDH